MNFNADHNLKGHRFVAEPAIPTYLTTRMHSPETAEQMKYLSFGHTSPSRKSHLEMYRLKEGQEKLFLNETSLSLVHDSWLETRYSCTAALAPLQQLSNNEQVDLSGISIKCICHASCSSCVRVTSLTHVKVEPSKRLVLLSARQGCVPFYINIFCLITLFMLNLQLLVTAATWLSLIQQQFCDNALHHLSSIGDIGALLMQSTWVYRGEWSRPVRGEWSRQNDNGHLAAHHSI